MNAVISPFRICWRHSFLAAHIHQQLLVAFVVNALVFCAILVFELANYCDFQEFIQKYNDVLWAFIVIAGIGIMLLFISNKTYRIEQKRRKR